MALVKCPDCAKEHSDSAAACPSCGRPVKPPPPVPAPLMKKNFGCGQAGCLGLLVFFIIAVWIGSSSTSSRTRLDGSATPPEPQLELQNWNWRSEYGYATASGSVKNISGKPLKRIQAVVSFYGRNGAFVTSDDAMIDYSPILPGQTSPFKVMARHNPAMSTARVEFKEMFGGTIEYRTVKPPPKKTRRPTASSTNATF